MKSYYWMNIIKSLFGSCVHWITNNEQGYKMPRLKFVRFWHVYKFKIQVINLKTFLKVKIYLYYRRIYWSEQYSFIEDVRSLYKHYDELLSL